MHPICLHWHLHPRRSKVEIVGKSPFNNLVDNFVLPVQGPQKLRKMCCKKVCPFVLRLDAVGKPRAIHLRCFDRGKPINHSQLGAGGEWIVSQGAYGDIDHVRAAISRGATAANEEDKSTYVDRQTNYASRGNHESEATVICKRPKLPSGTDSGLFYSKLNR